MLKPTHFSFSGNSRCLTVQEYFSDQQTEKELILNVYIPFSNEVPNRTISTSQFVHLKSEMLVIKLRFNNAV